MTRSGKLALVCGMLLLLASPLVGADVADETPTYTNADLEKFGPPSDSAPAAVDEPAGWRFVNEFLEREQSKFESERAAELARREIAIKEEQPRREPRYRLAYPYHGHIYRGGHVPRHPYRIGIPAAKPRPKKKLLGSDAFPSNRRRAEREAGH